MGHERVGVLPKTQRWSDIVERVIPAAKSPDELAELASRTLQNVRARFQHLHKDRGVQAAFGFLIALAVRSKLAALSKPVKPGVASIDHDLEAHPSALRIVQSLQSWVRENAESFEYAAIAQKAAADAIMNWTKIRKAQPSLFPTGSEAEQVWAAASSGAGFCEVSRLFFSSFTERYLKYFLDRVASAETSSIAERGEFSSALGKHVDAVSKHAFEISKITQSFAAGWFNKFAGESRPTDREIEAFLAVAFGKMQEEILRESLE